MWSKKISVMMIVFAFLLAGLSVFALSTAVAQTPQAAPLTSSSYTNSFTADRQYVPSGPTPQAPDRP